MKKLVLIFLSAIICFQLQAQSNDCLTVHLERTSKGLLASKQFNTNEFYLIRKCVYNFVLENNQKVNGQLIDIKRDTLVLTNYFNEAAARAFNDSLDTVDYHISQFKAIRVISDRTLGAYHRISLSNYQINFVLNCAYSSFTTDTLQLYTNDTAKFEIFPILTAQGYDHIYEENGQTFYYRGQLTKSDPKPKDSTYQQKNFGWFTPSAVEEINGVAIGIWAENTKNGISGGNDSMKIRGVNIELFPLGFVWILAGTIFNNPNESMDLYNRMIKNNHELKVSGVNLSLSGTISRAKINGLNVSGLSTSVGDINGISVSGFNTFAFIVNGINISSVQNIAVRCRGIQIGLFNRAKDLKGLQIGLWNNNGRFSLPILNFGM